MWRELPGIDDEDIYKNIMLMSLHGQSKDALAKTKLGAWEYDIVAPLYKCNMTDIMAAIGLVQMERYPGLLARRRQIIGMYNDGIKADDVEYLEHYTDVYTSSGHLYLVRLLGKDSDVRNAFITKMAENGIATNVHFKPLPMHTAYKELGFDIADYPNSYEMYHNEVTLPLHTNLTDELYITPQSVYNGIYNMHMQLKASPQHTVLYILQPALIYQLYLYSLNLQSGY